jgi:hypothetical protein
MRLPGKSFPIKMFGRMEKVRRSRRFRFAAVLAACLTAATAFGLHPEPDERAAAAGPHRLELPAARDVDSGPHDCLACRAHRPLVSVAYLAFVTPLARPGPRVLALPLSFVPAFEPSRPDGRAPPDLS